VDRAPRPAAPDGDLGAAESFFGVSGEDYLHETHGFAPNQVTCTDTTPNTDVAVELDWERFLWDIVSKEGVTFAQVVDTFAGASPRSWNSGVNAQWAFETSLLSVTGSSVPWDDHAPRNGVAQ
jgi:hypothetical protein